MEHCIRIGRDADPERKSLLQEKLKVLLTDGAEVKVFYYASPNCFYIRVSKVGHDCEVIHDLFRQDFEFCSTGVFSIPKLVPVLLEDFTSYTPGSTVSV